MSPRSSDVVNCIRFDGRRRTPTGECSTVNAEFVFDFFTELAKPLRNLPYQQSITSRFSYTFDCLKDEQHPNAGDLLAAVEPVRLLQVEAASGARVPKGQRGLCVTFA